MEVTGILRRGFGDACSGKMGVQVGLIGVQVENRNGCWGSVCDVGLACVHRRQGIGGFSAGPGAQTRTTPRTNPNPLGQKQHNVQPDFHINAASTQNTPKHKFKAHMAQTRLLCQFNPYLDTHASPPQRQPGSLSVARDILEG